MSVPVHVSRASGSATGSAGPATASGTGAPGSVAGASTAAARASGSAAYTAAATPGPSGPPAPLGFDVLSIGCPSHAAMRDVTGRWAPLVLLALEEGCTRFGEIHRRVGGSSERMIAQTLRTLQGDRVVERSVDPDGRPLYGLTPTGRDIARRVRDLSEAVYAHLASRDAR